MAMCNDATLVVEIWSFIREGDPDRVSSFDIEFRFPHQWFGNVQHYPYAIIHHSPNLLPQLFQVSCQ